MDFFPQNHEQFTCDNIDADDICYSLADGKYFDTLMQLTFPRFGIKLDNARHNLVLITVKTYVSKHILNNIVK